MNLPIEIIRTWATDDATFRRGKSYFDGRRVRRMRILPGPGRITLKAEVSGSYFSSYRVELILGESAAIQSAHCECPAFEQYDGLCKHCVAVLLAAQGGLDAAVPERAVSRSGAGVRKLIEDYARVADGGAEAGVAGRVRLEPELSFQGLPAAPFLSFKMGVSRMYVVRAPRDFIDALHRGSHVEYGKELAFTHVPDAFEEKSRALALMLAERDEECEAYTRMRNAMYGVSDKRLKGLSPAALSDFFAIFEGETISLSGHGALRLVRGDPAIRIAAKKLVNGEVEITAGDALLARMPAHLYVKAGGALYQTSLEMARAMGGFLALLAQSKRRLILSGRDIDAFCADVLPIIRPYIALDGEAAFEGHAPEVFEPRAYLDLPERDLITCRPVAGYDGDELDLFRDEKSAHTRDRRAEHAFLRALGQLFGAPENGAYAAAGEEKIAGLLDEGISRLQEICDVRVSDRVRRLSFAPQKRPTVEVSLSHGLLDLTFDYGEFPKDELAAALSAYREKRKYYRLADGRFVRFSGSAFGEMARLADGLMLTGKQMGEKAQIPAFRAMYLDGLFRDENRLNVRRDPAFRSLVNAISQAADGDYAVPADFCGELRPYQEAGYRWMRTLSDASLCGILADDMGLGKTIQFIALLLGDDADAPSLIACPASVCLNWESELRKFAPHLPAAVIGGTAAQRAAQIRGLKGRGVAITSYDLLRRDAELYKGVRFRYFAIDEAQYIKNRATKNAQAAKGVVCARRFALTGTPIENRLSELWSIFDFLMPGYLYSYNRFRERFELPISKNNDAEARRDLKRLIAPFILRRLKKDVLSELPPKVTTVSAVALEGEQRKLYEAYAAQAAGELDEMKDGASGERRIKALAMLTRLRQICCDPALCLENYEGPSAKLDACMDLLSEAVDGGHKALLFSQFTSMLEIIQKRLRAAGISFCTLTGETPKEERLSLVNRFNADDTSVFLISLKAGGTGLNLTGADMVILYDPWWNTAAQDQAIDRAHRIGQERSVMVYKLIAKNTVEEKILALQKRKGELADVIEGEGASIGDLSEGELLALFSVR
jgi:superfamily II DNA or RNA helicase